MTNRRLIITAVLFLLWGLAIICGTWWLIAVKRNELLKFADKISTRNITVYPVRAPILDRNGEKVCWTEWIFYVCCKPKNIRLLKSFCSKLDISFAPEKLQDTTLRQKIPPEKLDNAVLLARELKLELQKQSVRLMLPLPSDAIMHIGKVIKNNGLWGIELAGNNILNGTPGFYNVRVAPAGGFEADSFKVIAPVSEGRPIYLKQSIDELICGEIPQRDFLR